MNKTALIAGGTGLIGNHLLNLILKDDYYSSVKLLVRKKIELSNPKLEQIEIDYDKILDYKNLLVANHVFCTLGTTIKKAGSQEAFKKVDYLYPLTLAEITKKNNAEQYLIVTSMGANLSSKIFYNRVKGEVEKNIADLCFKCFHIFRPSLLLGVRNEARTGEQFATLLSKVIAPFMKWKLLKYKPIEAEKVAKAMLHFAKKNMKGINLVESDKLQKF